MYRILRNITNVQTQCIIRVYAGIPDNKDLYKNVFSCDFCLHISYLFKLSLETRWQQNLVDAI